MTSHVKGHVRKSQQERRKEILEATLQLISKYGVEGATVARIAAAVGITPGALYRHFDSRAALIAEANRLANERSKLWTDSSNEPDMLQRLQELGGTHAAWAEEHYTTVVRPFFLTLATAPDDEAADPLVITEFKSFKAVIAIAEQGIRQGSIRKDVRPEDVAWALHMFAWMEDIAVMAGATEFIEDGVLGRNLRRMLDSFRA